MVRIEITSGIDAGKVVELDPGTHIIGRLASADLRLEVDSVSGRHLELVVGSDQSVRFKDLGSTNGTFSGGVKVQDGEWFAGSEIRLGNLTLKLVDENATAGAANDAADADLHARARQEAMSGKRRGGPWILLLLLLFVGGAGGAAWYLNLSDDPEKSTGRSSSEQGAQVPVAAQLDLIQDMGVFFDDDSGSWSLPEGVSLSAGSLSAKGGPKRISLVRQFPITSASLRLRAQVSGEPIYPLVEWGVGEAESGTTWMGAALTPAGIEIPLPEQAQWFQLSLVMAEGSTLRELRVEAGETSALEGSHENHPTLQSGGNLVLGYNSQLEWMRARSASGSWVTVAGGMQFQPEGSGHTLYLRIGEAGRSEGGLLILSEGGPIPADNGVVVDQSPGLLLGAGAHRLMIHFAEPCQVVARDSMVSLQPTGPLELRWELTEALTQASRLARKMESASDAGDSVTVLRTSSELLRDWPLVDAKVQLAQQLVRQVIQQGRSELNRLERETADASFLQAADDLESLQEQAHQLGIQMQGTDLEPQVLALADKLGTEAEFLRQSHDVEEAVYRKRLSTALSKAYPLLAAWLRREEAL
jgi:Inner membrane component of T3SS, cytoplasmic domain